MITEKEIEHLHITLGMGLSNSSDKIWINAFVLYNENNYVPLSMNCLPCYYKVYIFFKYYKTKKMNETEKPSYVKTSEGEVENELLDEIENAVKPKFKLNPIGVYFVGSLICVVWKFIDLLLYIF